MKFWCASPRGLKSAVITGILLTMAACAGTRGGPIPYNVSNFGVPDAPSTEVLPSAYEIAPMDTLTVTVFGVPDLSHDYLVDLLGNISLPLVGDVPAAGKTPNQLKEFLKAKLGEKYYQNPDVTVGIKSSAGRNVTVDGAVGHAGAYPVAGSMTLMQAVALAGGTTEDANAHRVAIFRTIAHQRQAAAFDLVSIRRGEMVDPPIYAGDVVVVDGNSINAALKNIFMTTPLLRIFTPIL